MKVKIKLLSDNAVMPKKAHNGDFCYDIVATSCEEIAPNIYKYGTGLAFQIDRSNKEQILDGAIFYHEELDIEIGRLNPEYLDMKRALLNLSIDLRPRSSVWKTGMVLSSCTGTIDEDYTGEVSAVYYHVMPTLPKYEVGDRIGQIKIGATFPIEFVEVETLNNTERGAGGYGSTGR